MTTTKSWRPPILVLALTLCTPSLILAQNSQTAQSGLGVKYSLSAIEHFEADIGNSQVDVSRYRIKADVDISKSRKMILTLGLSYSVSDYTFSGPPADPWSDPWGEIKTANTGISVILPGTGRWSYFLAGTFKWSGEDDADTADSLVYGFIGSAVRVFRMDRRIGFGVGVFEGLEETKVFPYAMVSWKLKDKLTLQNPFRAGPAGPAGLELAYYASEKWQIGGGAAYRSFRFRLDDTGIAPEGIGEMTGIPVWVRASLQASPKAKLHLHAGAILAGEVILENNSGHELESKHMDPAPLAAVTFEMSL